MHTRKHTYVTNTGILERRFLFFNYKTNMYIHSYSIYINGIGIPF